MVWPRLISGRQGSTFWQARLCLIEGWWARVIWSKAPALINNTPQSSYKHLPSWTIISTCLAASCNPLSRYTPIRTYNRCNINTQRSKTYAKEVSLILISLCFSSGKRYIGCRISKLNLQPPKNKASLQCPFHSPNTTSNHVRVTYLKTRWICLQLALRLTYNSRCSRKVFRPILTRLSPFSDQRRQQVQWLAVGKPDRLILHFPLRKPKLQIPQRKLSIKINSQAFLTCTMNKTIAVSAKSI